MVLPLSKPISLVLCEHSLLHWSLSVCVFPCCGQGCSSCLPPLSSANGRNGSGSASALPWLGRKSLAAGTCCCFSKAGHELSGLLLLWLCSKGPLQHSPSHPGTRGTWGVSGVVAPLWLGRQDLQHILCVPDTDACLWWRTGLVL